MELAGRNSKPRAAKAQSSKIHIDDTGDFGPRKFSIADDHVGLPDRALSRSWIPKETTSLVSDAQPEAPT